MSVSFQVKRVTAGDYVDYTPSGADVSAGDVVVQGELVGIAERAIEDGVKGALAVTGVFDVEREASTAFTAGDEVWWDADGTSEDGNTGAAVDTSDSGTNKFLGYAVADVADADANLYVRVAMRNDVSRTTMAMGDLSDCGDGAPTSGDLLIGDGDSWEAEPVSGDVTLSNAGVVTLTANNLPITEAIVDGGDASAIPVTNSGSVSLETDAGAETRTLAVPTYAGQVLNLAFGVDNGDCVVTVASAVNQAGNNTLTFADAGDNLVLIGIDIDGTLAWRVVANDGVALSTV